MLARTTEDNEGSQRTAAAAGLVRRRDLEAERNGLWTVVFGPPENSLAPEGRTP